MKIVRPNEKQLHKWKTVCFRCHQPVKTCYYHVRTVVFRLIVKLNLQPFWLMTDCVARSMAYTESIWWKSRTSLCFHWLKSISIAWIIWKMYSFSVFLYIPNLIHFIFEAIWTILTERAMMTKWQMNGRPKVDLVIRTWPQTWIATRVQALVSYRFVFNIWIVRFIDWCERKQVNNNE